MEKITWRRRVRSCVISNEKVIRLAVQKSNRLCEEALSLLKKAGFSFFVSERNLSTKVENFPIELLFLRGQDIPEMIIDGAVDLGIIGENTMAESVGRENLIVQKKLGFGKCALFLAAPKNSGIQTLADFEGKKIATSYPQMTKDFLEKKGIGAEIIPMSGSVEIAPAMNIADAICDLVSSGATLSTHNIVPIEKVFASEVSIVSAKEFAKGDLFEEFVMRIDSVLRAKNLKSVVMNAPKSALGAIEAILPGLDSPTVMPLARQDWIAIHSVVEEDADFWEKISALKKAGASGILISPIDRVIF